MNEWMNHINEMRKYFIWRELVELLNWILFLFIFGYLKYRNMRKWKFHKIKSKNASNNKWFKTLHKLSFYLHKIMLNTKQFFVLFFDGLVNIITFLVSSFIILIISLPLFGRFCANKKRKQMPIFIMGLFNFCNDEYIVAINGLVYIQLECKALESSFFFFVRWTWASVNRP